MRTTTLALSIAVLAASAAAQGALRGNGVPAAYIETTPAVIGGSLEIGLGSPTQPNGFGVLSLSGGYTSFPFPLPALGGPVAMDPFHPAYVVLFYGLDAQGHASLTAPITNDPALLGADSYYVNTVTFESVTQWSVSKTAHIDWMLPDAWEQAAPMSAERQLHTATALGTGPRDNLSEVLICGGATGSFITPVATASAELFSPVTRATTALPDMSTERASHRTARLNDGRLLITGGVATGGTVLSSCEFFDPETLTFAPAPNMSSPRSGHAMTVLPDGRVLATGGVTNWQNASAQFIAALNSATSQAEIFDPVTNSWSSLAMMASPRLGHSQTVLQDGRVLIIGGINGGYTGQLGGGQVPTYTTSCEIFDPQTNTFAGASPLTHTLQFGSTTLNGRAMHGATLLPNGTVLVTGGFVATIATPWFNNDETITTPYCDVWDPATDTWTETADLPESVAFHTCVQHNGAALVTGGFGGFLTGLVPTEATTIHDGVTATSQAPMDTARAAHTMTRLCDGTLLVYGGAVWPSTLDSGEIYLPN